MNIRISLLLSKLLSFLSLKSLWTGNIFISIFYPKNKVCFSARTWENMIYIRSPHFLSIFYRLFTSLRVQVLKGSTLNTFGVYQVRSKKHMLVLSAGFCRRVVDWSIYNTFMWTPIFASQGLRCILRVEKGDPNRNPWLAKMVDTWRDP